MKRLLKIAARITGILLLLLLLLWGGIAIYVNVHKQQLLASITNQLNENINGTLTVESMEPTLVKGFPAISVSLKNVLLRDSLFAKHHHNLLEAKSMSITVNAFSILRNAPRIRDVHIEDGKVYLFTDSNGYSNSNIFVKKAVRDSSGSRPSPKLNHFFFDNVHFILEHKSNKKYFDFEIAHLEGKFDYSGNGWTAFMKINTLVNALDFYNPNGPFLKKKHVKANLTASFDDKSGLLEVPLKKINVEGNDVTIGAKVFLKDNPVLYKIEIAAEEIDFEEGRSMLSNHIAGKLSVVHLTRPLKIEVSISGKDQKRDQPVVRARWHVTENTLEGQGARIEDCNFDGYFFNQVNPAVKVCDENSVIALDFINGNWEGIPFTGDSVRIDNLVSPVLSAHLKSDFKLNQINDLLDNKSMRMDKGDVALDLKFKGGIDNNDSTQPFILGYIKLKNAAINYVPRNLEFTNTSAELLFTGSDLFINNVKVQHGVNQLNMKGSMVNLLNFYYTDPEKVVLDWQVSSNAINLNQYKSFFKGRNKSTIVSSSSKKKQLKSVNRFSEQLDQVLDKSTVHLRLNVAKLTYQKFDAKNIAANIKLNQNAIILDNVSVEHSGGKIQLSAKIDQSGSLNNFTASSNINHVKVHDFFAAFGNFGQNTLTDKNIKGDFYMQANISGSIKDDGSLVPLSLNGIITSELKNGVLTDFSPLRNVGRYAFPRRDFNTIQITSLKNKMEIKGDKIKIYPLKLSSDAINADIEGIYAFGTGTDINVDIPLRNPKNDALITDDSVRKEKRNKGLVVHLNVADKEDGKMKIRLVGKAIPVNEQTGLPGKRKRKNLLGF